MKISAEVIYLTDGGAAYCGDHLGASARFTGRDISGQPIMPVTPEDMAYMDSEGMGDVLRCETCGKRPSRLHVA